MDWSVRHYRVTAKLGEGGMGEVFLATDTKLDRPVALKLLPAPIAGDAVRRRRFLTEARAASALTHANVCTVYEVGETEDGRPYIAMEYLRGRTLAEICRQQRLLVPQIVAVAAQVADALDAAHELRIVHRDIKPSNISLNDRGQVKVLDFGLAKKLDEHTAASPDEETLLETKSGQIMGTPSYMSPEQALGRDLDHRSDIFSLGIVLYELASGRRPFAGASLGDTIDKIVHHQPASLSGADASVPAEFERIVFKCLEKDATRRYQTPRDLVLDLQGLQRRFDVGGVPLPVAAGSQGPAPASTTAAAAATQASSATPARDEIPDSDVFISYATADDRPLTADQAGWVTQFHRDLEVRIEQLFGEPARIWRHANPPGAAPESARLAAVLPGVKALISVVSPPFLKSGGCRRDVETFRSSAEQAGTYWVENRPRLLKVVKRPVEPADWQPPMADILPRLNGFEFYELDPTTGRLIEYDESFGPIARQRYHERIYDLAQEVCHVLRGCKRLADSSAEPPAGTKLSSGKAVFLAETTADLRAERDKLRRELTERGHRVLPDRPLPMEAAEFEADVKAALAQADAVVHMLGSRYGMVPEGADVSSPELQLRLVQASGRAIPRLLWLPAAVEVQDPRQAALIEKMRDDPQLHAGGELIQGSLNLLKDLLLRRLDPPPKTNPTPLATVASGPPRVYLVCDPADEDQVAPIEDFLFDQGCEVSLPLFEGTSGEIAEAHRRNLQTCDAVLIYYGSTTNHWVEIKLMDLVQAPGYGRAQPFRVRAVLVPPSEDRRKNRFRTHVAEVIRSETTAAAETLRPFLQQLQTA
jgi:predicted Ser/Thr protein kinase